MKPVEKLRLISLFNALFLMLAIFVADPSYAKSDLLKADKEMVKAKSEKIINKININTASTKELSKNLKGIGKLKAEAIVAYREKYGDFKDLNDLSKVKGIGKKVLDKNKEIITLQ